MLPPTYVEGFHDVEAVKAMRYSTLGKTGLVVSHLSLGGGALGGFYGEFEEAEAIETVREALRMNIHHEKEHSIGDEPIIESTWEESELKKEIRKLKLQCVFPETNPNPAATEQLRC